MKSKLYVIKRILQSVGLAFMLLFCYTCRKELVEPFGNNKLEISGTTLDSLSYFAVKINSGILSTGNNIINDHGFCWSKDTNPVIGDTHISLGYVSNATSFTTTLDSLQPGTKYFLRSYASIPGGVVYGAQSEFTTLKTGKPIVITDTITKVTYSTALCKGIVISDSGLIVISRGLCWSIHPEPTVNDSIITSGAGLGSYEIILHNLVSGIIYYVRAFASNAAGTSYGIQKALITIAQTAPIITTDGISSITTTGATSGGNITSDGGSPVTARGVCWSLSSNPISGDSHTVDSTGIGTFVSKLSGLTSETQYFVKAYATNSKGTSYGEEKSFTTLSVELPVITTVPIYNVTVSSAVSGGEVISDEGAPVTDRGVCWSTSPNPTTADSHTNNGIGIGTFISNLAGLTTNTLYFVKAFATNSKGTAYGNELSFTTLGYPTVITTAITNIAQTTAKGLGNLTFAGGTPDTEKGICWSTSPNPLITGNHIAGGTGLGSFACTMNGLTENTLYYVKAYATNSVGTSYGIEKSFTTIANPLLPIVTTANVSNITGTTATGWGNVASDGGASVTARGVCWSTSPGPTTIDAHTSNGIGIGTFTSNITGLNINTNYYVRAYATNSQGTAYGNEIMFSTLGYPTVITSPATNITQTSATSGGNVIDDGGGSVIARGVCWSTSPNPSIANNHTSDGVGVGVFSSEISGLAQGTYYYIKAYATNALGTSYGDALNFTTLSLPTVTTTQVTNIAANSAISGGEVVNDGGAFVIERGVCWSYNQNPTIADNHTNDGSGTGIFISYLTGLAPFTTYFVRAYVINSVGTAYGNELSFITEAECGILTVQYGGDSYNTKIIGTQCWMTKNLNIGTQVPGAYNQYDNGQIEKYCYNDDPAYCSTYGGLYQWDEMMQYNTTPGTQGICPQGWHIPTDVELTTLTNNLGGSNIAGGKLKEIGLAHWNDPNTGATNSSGFTALGGGNNGGGIKDYGHWWSSNEESVSTSWTLNLYHDNQNAGIGGNSSKSNGFSVRCIKNL